MKKYSLLTFREDDENMFSTDDIQAAIDEGAFHVTTGKRAVLIQVLGEIEVNSKATGKIKETN